MEDGTITNENTFGHGLVKFGHKAFLNGVIQECFCFKNKLNLREF